MADIKMRQEEVKVSSVKQLMDLKSSQKADEIRLQIEEMRQCKEHQDKVAHRKQGHEEG